MVNFLQHKSEIIQDFCNAFKKDAYKDIWGIRLNCVVKPKEEVWLNKNLFDYQTLSEQGCASGCTVQNPAFVITQYATCDGTSPFPTPFPFNPNNVFCTTTMQEYTVGCGGCCYTSVVVNNGSVITYNFTVTNQNTVSGQIVAGSTTFVYSALIGFNIQLALSGYGFFNPGTQYTFDNTTGTITLLGGLLFNISEVYTIFAYK